VPMAVEGPRQASDSPFDTLHLLAEGGLPPDFYENDDDVGEIVPAAQWRASYMPLRWAIRGLLARGQVTALTGLSTAGKTALALRIAGHKANGLDFAGHKVPKEQVLYVALENPTDVQRRYMAMVENWPGFDESLMHFAPISQQMTPEGLLQRIEKYTDHLHRSLSIIIIDSAAALSDSDNELDNIQQRAFARALREIATENDCAVLVLCHPTKSVRSYLDCLPRGGGGFYNEIDNNWTLWTKGDLVEVNFTKLRMAHWQPFYFRHKPIETTYAKDDEDQPLKSVTIELVSEVEQEQAFVQARGHREKIITVMFSATAFSSKKEVAIAAGIVPFSAKRGDGTLRTAYLTIGELVTEKMIDTTGRVLRLTPKARKFAREYLGLGPQDVG
jgi:KaiC/GvpD/RAD55 family RecA-like ATPase